MNRIEVINELVKNNVETCLINSCEDDTFHLECMLREGFKGFNHFTDKELENEYKEIFNKEIRINE